MSNLRTKDICNCDQALSYREAIETVLEYIKHPDIDDPEYILGEITTTLNEALDHPEAE